MTVGTGASAIVNTGMTSFTKLSLGSPAAATMVAQIALLCKQPSGRLSVGAAVTDRQNRSGSRVRDAEGTPLVMSRWLG
jgi:hypothetical protein